MRVETITCDKCEKPVRTASCHRLEISVSQSTVDGLADLCQDCRKEHKEALDDCLDKLQPFYPEPLEWRTRDHYDR